MIFCVCKCTNLQVTEAPSDANERLQEHIQSLFKQLDSDVEKVLSVHADALARKQRMVILALAVVGFLMLDDYLFDLF